LHSIPPPRRLYSPKDKDGDDVESKEAKKKSKEEAKALKDTFKPLTSWWKEQLGAKVRHGVGV
jgi:hypothetical protein